MKYLKIKNLIIIYTLLILFGCKSKKNESLLNYQGTWVCYKYNKDATGSYSKMFEFDEAYAKEFSSYFWFEIKDDTITVNNKFKMPVELTTVSFDSCNIFLQKMLKYYDNDITNEKNPQKNYCKIEGKHGITYKEYYKKTKKDRDSFIKNSRLIYDSKWCFSDVILLTHYGYCFYFKKGIPKDSSIQGIPGNNGNSFVVNRIYSNSSIIEAVHQLIKEFPKGTEELIAVGDEPNEKGERETWFPMESGTPYGSSAEYIWENKNKVTVKIHQNKNSFFIIEFIKKEADVHVKYWNKVIFPSEPGYRGS